MEVIRFEQYSYIFSSLICGCKKEQIHMHTQNFTVGNGLEIFWTKRGNYINRRWDQIKVDNLHKMRESYLPGIVYKRTLCKRWVKDQYGFSKDKEVKKNTLSLHLFLEKQQGSL